MEMLGVYVLVLAKHDLGIPARYRGLYATPWARPGQRGAVWVNVCLLSLIWCVRLT
jgi:hypothetical protein